MKSYKQKSESPTLSKILEANIAIGKDFLGANKQRLDAVSEYLKLKPTEHCSMTLLVEAGVALKDLVTLEKRSVKALDTILLSSAMKGFLLRIQKY